MWWAVLAGLLITLLFSSCRKPDPPEPDPDPDPDPPEPKWEDYYPAGWYVPVIDWDVAKWQMMTDEEKEDYDDMMIHLMNINNRLTFDDLTLHLVLFTKVDGEYYFKWTSDMETWMQEDYWATPYQFVISKEGLGDCDDFCRLHCDYLTELCEYWLVWWVEVYWQRLKGESWWSYGHAITIYKRSVESPYRCFSNQSLLGSTNGYETIDEIIRKFVPDDAEHRLLLIRARHPLTGKLLFEKKGGE